MTRALTATAATSGVHAPGYGSTLMLLSLSRLAISWAQIALASKRLHDFNWRAWWLLAPLGLFLISFPWESFSEFDKILGSADSMINAAGRVMLCVGLTGLSTIALQLRLFFRGGDEGSNRFDGGASSAPKRSRISLSDDGENPDADAVIARALAERRAAAMPRPTASAPPPAFYEPRAFGRRGARA